MCHLLKNNVYSEKCIVQKNGQGKLSGRNECELRVENSAVGRLMLRSREHISDEEGKA